VDLQKNSSLYFLIGLCLFLFISWQAIEWKTYEKSVFDYESLTVQEEEEEEIPIINQPDLPPPPPPPPVAQAPTEIEIVEDEKEVEETIIESSETTKDEIIEVERLEIEEEVEEIDVPFAVIEDVPVYPGCENVEKDQLRTCFQDKINKHILKNFRYPEIAQEMGIQGRVYVNFVISKEGNITNVKMRGPDKNLEKEAHRIISLLPNITPGKQRGKPVNVPFSITIVFKLQD
ncbi:MAG: energy transducer TonB, partial [Bacteroidetes bacterium]|nr:energy transducer TonB [Bacteroidota bacterium]